MYVCMYVARVTHRAQFFRGSLDYLEHGIVAQRPPGLPIRLAHRQRDLLASVQEASEYFLGHVHVLFAPGQQRITVQPVELLQMFVAPVAVPTDRVSHERREFLSPPPDLVTVLAPLFQFLDCSLEAFLVTLNVILAKCLVYRPRSQLFHHPPSLGQLGICAVVQRSLHLNRSTVRLINCGSSRDPLLSYLPGRRDVHVIVPPCFERVIPDVAVDVAAPSVHVERTRYKERRRILPFSSNASRHREDHGQSGRSECRRKQGRRERRGVRTEDGLSGNQKAPGHWRRRSSRDAGHECRREEEEEEAPRARDLVGDKQV